MHTVTEWDNAIEACVQVDELHLVDLLDMVAEATRELCAEFPQHQCHNGATNNWKIGEKVVKHVRANYLPRS